MFVKNPKGQTPGRLHYYDVGDFLTREQKLAKIAGFGSIASMPWKAIEPSVEGDWLIERSTEFAVFSPIGEKGKTKSRDARVFAVYSAGLKTNRDAWAYNFSSRALTGNVSQMLATYAEELAAAAVSDGQQQSYKRTMDATRIKWDGVLESHFAKRKALRHTADWFHTSVYRPFAKSNVAFSRTFNNSVYLLGSIFPTCGESNVGFVMTGVGAAMNFTVLMVDSIPDLSIFGAQTNSQFFPRYSYSEASVSSGELDIFGEGDLHRFERTDNITDEILLSFRESFGEAVTKNDIFFYVYGLLHSREYRAEFENDLRLMLPRIPKVKAFKQFVEAGRALSELHLNYESVEPYPLIENAKPNASLRVTKMRYAKDGRQDNKTTIIYNDGITLTSIPEEAQEYMLGSRSALDWIIERYQVKTDKASGIVNDPNAWGEEHGDPRYILDLIKRITTVSVETVKIVKGLPALEVIGS